MGFQLSSVLHAVGVWRGPAPVAPAGRRAPVAAAPDPEDVDAVAARVAALAYPGPVVDAVRARWGLLTPAERRQVAAPLTGPPGPPGSPGHPVPPVVPLLLGSERAVQVDGTTCGSSVLSLLAAAGDPVLAWWVVRGEQLVVGPAGGAVTAVPPAALDALGHGPARPVDRFAALQHWVKDRSTRTALLGLPWPPRLGTPPWGASEVARFGRVRYGHAVVDDTDRAALAATRAAVDAALDRGVPVPVYAGGDTDRGVQTAVPRHVVLLTGRTADGTVGVYEPSGGMLHHVPGDVLWHGGRPQPALGGWSHVCWVLLPH